MSRKINMGNNSQYIEKAETVTQNNFDSGRLNLPETVTEEQWDELLQVIKAFSSSPECQALVPSDNQELQTAITTAEREGRVHGWARIKSILEDTANASTIFTPLLTFIAANSGQISQWIQSIFK